MEKALINEKPLDLDNQFMSNFWTLKTKNYMRISGNYLDRFRYNIFPMAVFCGMICSIFSSQKLQAFLVLGGMILVIIWLIDTLMIFTKLGKDLNRLFLTDKILFNGIEIEPSQIIKISTENIYPDSIISKWRITIIRFDLDDSSHFYILAKPHSILFFMKNLALIFWNYYRDWRRYKNGKQRGFAPLSSYFIAETTQTLNLLTSEYPDLKLKIF